jgi:hypothetical protein
MTSVQDNSHLIALVHYVRWKVHGVIFVNLYGHGVIGIVKKRDWKCAGNIILRRVRLTTLAMKNVKC